VNNIFRMLRTILQMAIAHGDGNASARDLLSARVDRLLNRSKTPLSPRANHFVHSSSQITRHSLQMGELSSDGSVPVWCTECNTVVGRREQRSQLG
jgi:hypothetical protein